MLKQNLNYNRINLVLFLVTLILFLPLISANLESLGTFKQGDTIRIVQVCSDATYINLSSVAYPNSSVAVSNIEMISVGSGEFYYDFNLTDPVGRFDYRGISDGCEETFASYFYTTPSGREVSDSKITANIVLFVFFLLIAFVFFFVTRKIDYERWHNSIIRRYEHRNHIRVIISSIGYNLMKNAFIWYYLFCLPIILLVTDIAYTFDVQSMIELLKIILAIYYYGFIVVGLFFFGYLQEWIVQIADQIKSLDFGVE